MKKSGAKRIKFDAKTREILAIFDAEEKAIAFLNSLHKDSAMATAIKALSELAFDFERHKKWILATGNRSKVFLWTHRETLWLNSAAEFFRSRPEWDRCPTLAVRNIFRNLAPDAAAFACLSAARWVCRQGGYHDRL